PARVPADGSSGTPPSPRSRGARGLARASPRFPERGGTCEGARGHCSDRVDLSIAIPGREETPMRFSKSFVPYGAYWSTPFCKWQGSSSHQNAIAFAADTARRALADRRIDVRALDGVLLGMTVLQKHQLYAGPWLSAALGAEGITGPTISQACATGARTVA